MVKKNWRPFIPGTRKQLEILGKAPRGEYPLLPQKLSTRLFNQNRFVYAESDLKSNRLTPKSQLKGILTRQQAYKSDLGNCLTRYESNSGRKEDNDGHL